MFVSRVPDNARYIGKDLFDTVLYYKSSRFYYTYYIDTKKVLRTPLSVLPDLK